MAKAFSITIVAFAFVIAALPGSVMPEEPDREAKIDFNRARQLIQRIRSGDTLTPDEEAYLKQARKQRLRDRSGRTNRDGAGSHGQSSVNLVPLVDFVTGQTYKGEDGGLYGGGKNEPPLTHQLAAASQMEKVVPRDAAGNPDSDGRIVFVSISMSNATQEFSVFKQLADKDNSKSSALTIVDCAQGGQAMRQWASPDAQPWSVAERRLSAAGVSNSQVQVAWVKLANVRPQGELQQHGRELYDDTLRVLQIARQRFPNLRVVYLASRTYGGYATNTLNPEPYAYESAFACRWLIQDQIKGEKGLNYDAERGVVKAPLLLWGPYLWANGVKGRMHDGLVWERKDFAGDGTHPSGSGREKVARQLLEFLKKDALAKSWFVRRDASGLEDTPAADLGNTIDLSDAKWTTLKSPWSSYFGTHYANSPDGAGAAWQTVRSYGGTHVGLRVAYNGSAPPLKGPFTGKEIRFQLSDFHAARGGKSAEQLIPELIEHDLTSIYLMTNIVRPSLEPFDQDRAYWAVRLIHEQYPKAAEHIVWQIGNEVVSGHFDPKGVWRNMPRDQRRQAGMKEDNFFGYDLKWKEDYYINSYLAPAIEAIERASKDVYGKPRRIQIALGSMNPYNRPNIAFLKNVMSRKFDSPQAEALQDQAVWQHIDFLTVHYMTGSSKSIDTLQSYYDSYLTSGQVKGIWITEDHGHAGRGPVTILERGFRFLDWVARNDLSADQTRLCWWGERQAEPGGRGEIATTQIGDFLAGCEIQFVSQPVEGGRVYAIRGGHHGRVERVLLAVIPDQQRDIEISSLRVPVSQSRSHAWSTEAIQYSVTEPGQPFDADMVVTNGTIQIELDRRHAGPALLLLTGTELPSLQSDEAQSPTNDESPIDWDRARRLNERSKRGENLSDEEQAYLERARRARSQSNRTSRPERSSSDRGGKQGAVAGPRISTDVCPLEEITVKTSDDREAIAVLRKPPGDGPFPAVVLLHGGLAKLKMEQLAAQSRSGPAHTRLLAAGYATVTATFHARGRDPQTPKSLIDCLAIINHIKKHPEIDHESIVLYGGSGGGSLALELAGETDLAAVAAGEPAILLYSGIFNKSNVRQLEELKTADPQPLYTPQLREQTQRKIQRIGCPLLILHGDVQPTNSYRKEILVPELTAAGKQFQQILYPDEPHGFYFGQRYNDPANVEKCLNDAIAFFQSHTKIAAKPMDPRSVGDESPSPSNRRRPPSSPRRSAPKGDDVSRVQWVDPNTETPAGTKYKTFHSRTIDAPVSYLVYLPLQYDTDVDRRFPVLYWLHGGGGSQRTGADFVDRAAQAMDSGAAPPMIIVLVNGLNSSLYNDSADGDRPVESVIVKDLVPHVDSTYRTNPHRRSRGIEGFSMGGYGAVHLGFKYPDVFGVISKLAGAVIDVEFFATYQNGKILNHVFDGDREAFDRNHPIHLAAKHADQIRDRTAIRIIVGDKDIGRGTLDANRQLHAHLLELGVEHTYHEVPGVAHNYRALYNNMSPDQAFGFYVDVFHHPTVK